MSPDPAAALESVRQARTCLIRPSAAAIDSATPHLELVEDALRRATGFRLPDLLELKRDLKQLRTLLDHAAALQLGWAHVLFASTCGYTETGDPARPSAPGKLSLEG
jgi:hypothetical protein